MSRRVIAATRLHLGKASEPPTDLASKLASFASFCDNCSSDGVIAVDCTPTTIANYDLVEHVRTLLCPPQSSSSNRRIHILPVTPWGRFIPSLNALLGYAAEHKYDVIVFVSAETSAPREALVTLLSLVTDDTLVAGAALPGHDVQTTAVAVAASASTPLPLTGRSSPWNTLAAWNVSKLALTGFQMVSEGWLTEDSSFGIEEVVATCLIQKLLGPENAKSKLISLKGVGWEQHFDDPERQQWHDEKMKSKLIRAERQLNLTGLAGVVYHL